MVYRGPDQQGVHLGSAHDIGILNQRLQGITADELAAAVTDVIGP